MSQIEQVKVWDILIRVFHWTLVTSFTVAYITEDDWLTLHSFAGYTIGSLILFRIIWGVIGTRYARFSHFVFSRKTTISYLKDIAAFNPKRYLGHNPAGGAMVIALLLSLIATVTTGLSVYGANEFSGPLVEFWAGSSSFTGSVLKELHEFFANFTLLLVIAHVAGVILASFQHGENLVLSMFTGKKDADH
ncbi:MAG: cytochrome b/b6 domain-containing protein [Chromatiales bacterium]|nr:cytochrome b/b6 domain-containing protein [Chromatiales bacterium]